MVEDKEFIIGSMESDDYNNLLDYDYKCICEFYKAVANANGNVTKDIEFLVEFYCHGSMEITFASAKSGMKKSPIEMAFQCTGSPKAASTIWKYVRRGGAMCELGFFVDNGDTTYNPHQDICNKEIKVTGSCTYQAKDWIQACEVLKEAQKDGLPVEELLSHKYALADINEAMEMNISMQGLKIVVMGE